MKDAHSIFEKRQSVHVGSVSVTYGVIAAVCESQLLQLTARVSVGIPLVRTDKVWPLTTVAMNQTERRCPLRPMSHRVGGERLGSTAKLIRVK